MHQRLKGRFSFPSKCVAFAVIQAMLVGCAQAGPSAGDGDSTTSPLPRGWQPRPAERVVQTNQAPLWGVPSFVAPQAQHCARPPAFSQDLGRQAQAAQYRRRDEGRRGGVGAASSMMEADALSHAPMPSSPAAATAPLMADAAAPAPEPASVAKRAAAPPGQRDAEAVMQSSPRHERVTAGMVDDNADFSSYLAFRGKQRDAALRNRDVSERYRVDVRDDQGRAVADAELALSWPGAREGLLWARTDASGTAWLHPRALLSPQTLDALGRLEVQARSFNGDVARATLQRGQKSSVALQLTAGDRAFGGDARTPLDLVFMVDATGSMGDEIDKLRTSMKTMVERIAGLPGGIDLCFGLVAYRDHGEEYLTRSYDLTNNLPAFQSVLSSLRAQAGGDEPEAVNEALERTVHGVSWRGAGTSRLVVMMGDAPPHMDYGGPYYDQTSAAALARGIKIHAVGASGLNKQGEAVFRSVAQATGGRFVFLTYKDARNPGSGPGSQTPHDVSGYSVSSLDDLIVRLVSEELERRTKG